MLSKHSNNAKSRVSKLKSPVAVRVQFVCARECKCRCTVLTLPSACLFAGVVLALTLLPTFGLLMSHSNANSAVKSSGKLISSTSDTSLLPRLALASNFPSSHIILNDENMSQGGTPQGALLRGP